MPNFSPNHLNYAPNTENNQNEILSDKQRLARLQNEIGSKVLTLVGFESRNKDIVNSSFEKARKQNEKLPGKNNERRNFAYLSRLDNMVEKHGDALEQKLWAASAENLVMDYEDIPDAYWKQQEQILRDNGQGRELSRGEKETLAEDLIEKQRESINTWSNYLGDKDCPYPLWFKVYAFDGVSKMGLINKETKEFEKRDKSTVASFPILNPEVLAKVYRNINEFYGVDKEDWLAQHPDDEKLVSLVKSGNFPKLYAKELFETKTIIKTPEKPEDIEGDWFTYQLGDEDELSKAAEGTGWCIADPNVAHNYLEYGNYGYSTNEGTDEESSSKAKFIIFKLKAPNSPDGYSTNGVASIRLDPDGMVTEVSGLNEGQAIEDSLIPTVKEKVLSLPGGKEFLQKFEDKQTLIRLDHKLQNGEDLTKEELSFLYELDRPIATLDTYNDEDPRITELKEKYGIEYALEKGIDANKLVSNLNPKYIAFYLDALLEHGTDIDVNELVSNLNPKHIAFCLDTLLRKGADIDVNELVSNLDSHDIVRKLDTLIEHGADIDVNELVSNLNPESIAFHLDTLLRNGADIDVNELVSNLDPYDIVRKLDTLLGNGADIDVNELVSNLDSYNIFDYLDALLRNGADINYIVSNLDPYDIVHNLDTLLEHGVDINYIVSNLDLSDIAFHLDTLLEHGADIDVNKLVSNLDSYDIAHNLDTLLEHGADIDNVIKKMHEKDIEDNIDLLRGYGAKLDNTY
ncbi:hypothetical protein HG470_000445 [Candidatus Saccharibacteria bacterium]|nr:hypothetical protein [Candidatus Saccharibacteria bacterium]